MRRTHLPLFLLLVTLASCQAAPQEPTLPINTPRTTFSTLTPFQPLPVSPIFIPTEIPSPTGSPTLPQTPAASPSPIPSPSPTDVPRFTLLFTGVIVPARCVQAAVNARDNADYLYDGVRELIQGADLAVGTLNATLSDFPPMTGCIFTYVLVGEARNADALANAGFDVMSVATNHIKNCSRNDCGDRAFFDTLDHLNRVGIASVGAGENHAQAMEPVVMTVKGVRVGIVSLGMVEPMAFAGEDTPGIAVLDEPNLRAAIEAARQAADIVIAMPHWGPEDTPEPNAWQLEYARVAVDAGADLVVGNHTHVVQAVQEIDSVPVFYGLGNFVFDQTWALDHQQGVILLVHFEGTELTGYDLIPTHVDGDGAVRLAGEAEAAEILERIRIASEALP